MMARVSPAEQKDMLSQAEVIEAWAASVRNLLNLSAEDQLEMIDRIASGMERSARIIRQAASGEMGNDDDDE